LARGARIVALEAIVEMSARYDPLAAAPTGLLPGFVVPRTHAENVCAAGDEELVGVLRLGLTHPSRSDVLRNWDKKKATAVHGRHARGAEPLARNDGDRRRAGPP
jgi:hypothetical protein